MGEVFCGKLDRITSTEDGTMIISFAVSGGDKSGAKYCVNKAKQWQVGGKERLRVELSQDRNKRSLSANAYFHVLVNKIAGETGAGNDEVKRDVVLSYGAVMTDDEGAKVGVKLPKSVDVNKIYPYAKWFDIRTENGKEFNCYIIYKQTHTLDSAEMARLIDGAIYEAKALDIQTETPEQIARMLGAWDKERE